MLDYYEKNLTKDFKFFADDVKYDKVLSHRIYNKNGILKDWLYDITGTPFVKDEAFAHENEYRFILEKSSDKIGRPLVVIEKFSELKFQVFVHSNFEDWKLELINGLLIEAGIISEVRRSDILTRESVSKFSKRYLNKLIEEKRNY